MTTNTSIICGKDVDNGVVELCNDDNVCMFTLGRVQAKRKTKHVNHGINIRVVLHTINESVLLELAS